MKDVCKKYNVNYFSAKNVLHIYIKEGRLSKKHSTYNQMEPYFLPVPKVQLSPEGKITQSSNISNVSKVLSMGIAPAEHRCPLFLHHGDNGEGESFLSTGVPTTLI
jgi:hypothetical protein